MEDHDYAEIGALKNSKSKKSKQAKEVKPVKTPNGTASLKRPSRDKQNGEVKKTSSTYRLKDSVTLNENDKKVGPPDNLKIEAYATVERKREPSNKQSDGPTPYGSLDRTNGKVQSRERGPSKTNVNYMNGPVREDPKKIPEKDFSGLYAKVGKRENGDVKTKERKVPSKEKEQRPEKGQEGDFSQLYAEVNKKRPQKKVTSNDKNDEAFKTIDIHTSAREDRKKQADEDFESNPYAEIKRRTSYHGKENVGSFPRSGKRGSLSLSFKSFRSQKSDVTDEGNDSLTSNSLYNLIPEEPDTPIPDIELLNEAPPLPPENTVPKGQDNSAFQAENANNSTLSVIDVDNFEDDGYKEAVRRRTMVKREQEIQKRRIKYLIVITILLFVMLVLVLGVVVYLVTDPRRGNNND